MARVLLLFGPESRDTAALGAFLNSRRHHVQIVHHARDLDALGRVQPPDVIVVDLSLDRPVDWQNLDAALQFAHSCPPRPMVLAVCDVFRGVPMQLRVERKGARFAWLT
jgi:hypothetical protein